MIFTDEKPFDPERDPLNFIAVRTPKRDTRVHIRAALKPEDYIIGGKEMREYVMMHRMRTLCGRVVSQHKYDSTGVFNDDRICIGCHKGMGEHSDRIFEREQDSGRGYREYTGENY